MKWALCICGLSCVSLCIQHLLFEPVLDLMHCNLYANPPLPTPRIWLVGCFGFNGPLRQYFSLYRTVPKEREKEERKDR